MMKADLHMHTTYSDGKKTPEELVRRARQNNIDIIAVTDHDVASKHIGTLALAKELGVKLITGIELSTIYKEKSVHLLGYLPVQVLQSDRLLEYEKNIKLKREVRAKEMIRRLKEYHNLIVPYDEVYELASGIIARPHVARVLVKHYPEYSLNDVFKEFLGNDCKAYVPSSLLSTQEGIYFLRELGAFISLAHPKLLKDFIHDDILSYEYDAIEAIYYQHDDKLEAFYKNKALEKGILITAGSDYHGIENDALHGDIGNKFLCGKDLELFLAALKEKGIFTL